LTYFLKGIFHQRGFLTFRWKRGILPFLAFIQLFGDFLEVRHHIASLRFLTFTALGIPHTCCDFSFWKQYRCPAEDPEEIENEHAYELERLEQLLDEFESEVIEILQDPGRGLDDLKDFWTGTWCDRVREVRADLDRDHLSDAERKRAEEIGVVWDRPPPPAPPTRSLNPFGRNTLDYWVYELDKIEAECQ
jgi:hypothetical protein